MKAQEIMAREDFKKCREFHGHVCPGLAIGYRASLAALEWLERERSVDEELVAVVETDACPVDAIQVLTGCTFGKGNFFFKDHGKNAFTFLSRETGKGVRVALKHGALRPSERQRELSKKIAAGTASKQEIAEAGGYRTKKLGEILESPFEDLFTLKTAEVLMPPEAVIQTSKPCAICREPTMPAKMIEQDGRRICRDCAEDSNGSSD